MNEAVFAFEPPERRTLRESCERFVRLEVAPTLPQWERDGLVPRELHKSAAVAGLLGVGAPEEFGGQGGDLVDGTVVTEAFIEAGASSGLMAALFTHGIALPHMISAGDPELVERFVRPTLAGELIGALAVTEPDGTTIYYLATGPTATGGQLDIDANRECVNTGGVENIFWPPGDAPSGEPGWPSGAPHPVGR